MTNRIHESYKDFKQAILRLKEAIKKKPTQSQIEVDRTIQRFEFTFELAWKFLKFMLNNQGIQVHTPRMIIKEAFRAGFINDGDGWIDMLEDRNKTAHIYDEEEAEKIYKKIKSKHFDLLLTLSQNTAKK